MPGYGDVEYAILDFSVTDPDGIKNTIFSFSLVSVTPTNGTGTAVSVDNFNISSTSGTLSIAEPLNVDQDKLFDFDIVVRVNDEDGLSNDLTLHLTIEDVNDNDPEPLAPSYTGTVCENEAVDTLVPGLDDIAFIDLDSNDFGSLVYTLEGAGSNFSLLDDTTNIITARIFDYETDSTTYSFSIVAKDKSANPRSGSASVVVTLCDKNDNRPSISTNLSAIATYTERGEPVIVADDVLISDKDSEVFPMTFAIVSITDRLDDDDEVLSFIGLDVPDLFRVGFADNGSTLVVIGEASVSEYSEFLSNITYENSAGEMSSPLYRTISFGISDMPLNMSDIEASGDDDVFLDEFELDLFFDAALDEEISYATAIVQLQPVNDQPQLNCPVGGLVDPLPSIVEDVPDALNNGTLVSTILSGVVSDEDTDTASIGIAVIATNNGHGVWEYWLSGSGSFVEFGNVSDDQALVLGPESKVRFNPTMHHSGSVSLTFKAWDGSAGTPEGDTVDTSTSASDLSSPFSLSTCEAAMEIISVNDLPYIDLDFGGPDSPNYVTSYTENQQPELIFLADPLNVVVTDVDHSFLQLLTVNISKEDGSCDLPDYPYDESLDYLNVNLTIMGVDELVFTVDKACYNYEYTANLTLQQWEYFIGTLRLSINNTEPSDHTRLVTYSISDGIDFSTPVTSTVSVELVSDNCPELALGQLSLNYVEHSAPIFIDTGLTISDEDYRATISSIEVRIVEPANSPADFCSTCLLNATESSGITGLYSSNTLVLTGPASVADFQSVLRTLTFVDYGSEPSFSSMITLALTIDDQTVGGCPDQGEVSIVLVPSNDHPVVIWLNGLDANYSIEYTEGSTGVAIVGNIVLEDADTVPSTSYNVTVEIVNGFVAGEDKLIVSDNAITPLEATDSRVVLEGSLIELSSYLLALRYANTKSIGLDTNARLIEFIISDAETNSDSSFTTVSIILVNDPPLLDLTDNPNTVDSMVTFSIGRDPVPIAPESSITDDSDNMANLTLLLQEINDDGTVLQRSDVATESLKFTTVSGISGSYNSLTGRLDFTNIAARDDYVTLLRSITYDNPNTNPSLNRRKVVITVTDEEGSSDTADAYISFADIPNPPIVDLNGMGAGQDNKVTFTTKEDEPVDLVPAGYITDVDGDNILSMVIEYTGASDPCSASAINFGNSFSHITVESTAIANGLRYDVESVFVGGSESITFDKILNGLTFSVGDDASQGVCTVTVQVTDARSSVSNKPQVTVTVTVGNEPPYTDLDLGRVGRHFSFVYTQGIDDIAHIVSIRNDSLARNITTLAPVGEAPGEADIDDTEIGVAVISALSYAGYSLTDQDSTELNYLNVRFIYSNGTDVIRYPCFNGTTSNGTIPEVDEFDVIHGNLSCDPIFTPCNEVIDLCTDLEVKVTSRSDEYQFEYTTGGTIERYAVLLGNLGYQYASPNIFYSNFLRTVNITAHDGQALSLGSLTTINITRPDDSPIITAPEPPEVAFRIWEDERPNRGYVFYTVPIINRDGTVPELDSYEIKVTDESVINETFSVDEQGNFRLIGSLDRETIPYYTVPISARFKSADQRSIAVSEILIEVRDINDNRPDVQSSYNVTVFEGQVNEFVVDVTATDADNGTNAKLMYSPLLGRYANLFSVNKTTGVLTTAAALDAPNDEYFLLVLIVQDLGDIFLSSHTVINVYVLPTPPDRLVFDASSDSSIVTSENTTISTTVGTVLAYEISTMDSSNVRYQVSSINPDQSPSPFDVSNSGAIFVSAQLNAENTSFYLLTIEAYSVRTDLTIIPAEFNVSIMISDTDENAPEFSPPGPFSISVLESVQVNEEVYMLTAIDQDLTEYSFVFERQSITEPVVDPADFPFDVLSNGSIVTKLSLDAEFRTQYSFEVSVFNELGNPLLVSTTTVTVTVKDVNDNAPYFINTPYTANVFETAANGTSVLQVFSSDADIDASNRVIEYTLLTVGVPFCMVDDVIEVCDSVQLTSYEEEGKVIDLTIRAMSGNLNNETSATIQVVLVNEFPPEFSPGDTGVQRAVPEQNCSKTNAIVLVYDFTATDEDGGNDGIIVYKLVETGVPFSINSSTGALETSSCVDAEESDAYSLTVQAVDPDFTVNSTISITVIDLNDHPPVADNPSVFYVRENETQAKFVFGKIVATDADITTINTDITYERSISGVEGTYVTGCSGVDIGINGDTGELMFCESVDFEAVGAKNFTFEVRLRNPSGIGEKNLNNVFSSKELPTVIDVIVYLLGSNEFKPALQELSFSFSVSENVANKTVLPGAISATDADSSISGGGMLKYFFSVQPSIGVDESCSTDIPFYANSNGVVRTCQDLDYETTSSYLFWVSVCDMGAVVMCTDNSVNVTVTILDRNDNPPIFSADLRDLTIYLPENDTEELVTLEWTDADSEANSATNLSLVTTGTPFGLDASNSLVVIDTGAIDFETEPNTYTLTIVAVNPPAESDDMTHNDTITIIIIITDINDVFPTISEPLAFTIAENQPEATLIGSVNATDPEDGDNGLLNYTSSSAIVSSSCTANVLFLLDASLGSITTCTMLDYEVSQLHEFPAEVCDNGDPVLCDEETFSITVTDLNDKKPVFENDPIQLSINENSPANVFLYTIVTSDEDSLVNSQVSYSFINVTAPFEIFNDTNIVYNGDSELDYESSTKDFILNLVAFNEPSDPSDLTQIQEATVLIEIIDRNDLPPVFPSPTDGFTVEEHNDPGIVVYTITSSDGDSSNNSNVYYEINTPNAPFAIKDSNIVISDREGLDRETLTNSYMLLVGAVNEPASSDDTTQTANLTLNINITDINDNTPYFIGTLDFVILESAGRFEEFGAQVKAKDADIGFITYSFLAATACPCNGGSCAEAGEVDSSGAGGSGFDFGDPGCTSEIPFDIDPLSGLFITCHFLDFEQYCNFEIEVQVCDSGTPQHCNQTSVTVSVMDVNDNNPVINGTTQFMVNETASVGDIVGCVDAMDVDTGLGGILSFASDNVIECSTDFPFEVLESTGCIRVCSGLNFESLMSYDFTLIVSDQGDPILQTSGVITIVVLNNNDHPPVITSSNIGSVVENAADEFVLQVEAFDIDEPPFNSITFSLVNDDGGRFSINATGFIFTTVQLDRETSSYHVIEVDVSDMMFPVTQVINITVEDTNDNNPEYVGPASFDIIENEEVSISLDFTDDDIDENAELVFTTTDSRFSFVNNQLTNNTTIDADPATGGASELLIEVTATDQGTPSPRSLSVNITLFVENVNDNEPILQAPFAAEIRDGTPPDTFIVAFSATDYDGDDVTFDLDDDTGLFYINETGYLFTNQSIELTGSVVSSIIVTVELSDGSFFAYYNITLSIVDNLPEFFPNAYIFYIAENSFSTEVGKVYAEDRILIDTEKQFVYTVMSSLPYGGFYMLNNSLISPDDYLDYEDASMFMLILAVGDGNIVSDTATVLVNINDENDNPPVISPVNMSVTLIENSNEGIVVATVYGIDLDSGPNGNLTYFLSGSPFFSIDSDGLVTMVNKSAADYETYTEFTLTYHVCDNGVPQHCSAVGYIYIAVVDVDDVPPMFVPGEYSATISELYGTNTFIFNVTIEDIDTLPSDLVLRLSPEQPLFTIQQVTGSIYTSSIPLDYETSPNHTFLVIVADTSGASDTASVSITVNDEEDNLPGLQSTVTTLYYPEDSLEPIYFDVVSIYDADLISQDTMNQATVAIRSSNTSNESYPLDGGYCDHDHSDFIDTSGYGLCSLSSCVDLFEHLDISEAVYANGIYNLDGSSLLRSFVNNPYTISNTDLNNFTYTVWVKVDAVLITGRLLFLEAVGKIVKLEVYVFTLDGQIYIKNGDEIILKTEGLDLIDGKYHQVSLQKLDSKLYIYVDAKLAAFNENGDMIDTGTNSESTIFIGEQLTGSMAQIHFCYGNAITEQDLLCLTSCGEVLQANSTANVEATLHYHTRTVSLTCNTPNTCSVSELNDALHTVGFVNHASEPHPSPRGVFFMAEDSVGFGMHLTLSLVPELTNDQNPVFDLNGIDASGIDGEVIYEENSGSVAIVGSSAILYDLDSGTWTFNETRVELVGPDTTIEELTYSSEDKPDGLDIENDPDVTLGLVISSNTEQSAAVFLQALRAIRYTNTESDPVKTLRRFSFTVYDFEGTHTNSPLAYVDLTITPANDPPSLAFSETSVTFDEEDRQFTVLDGVTVTLTDPDNTQMKEAIVVLSNRINGESETLSLDVAGTGVTGVTATYDSPTGTLSIVGSATIASYITLLKAIKYSNPDFNPTDANRNLQLSVRDNDGKKSSDVTIAINIKLFNDPLVIVFESSNSNTNFLTFVEDTDECIYIAQNVTITDPEEIGVNNIVFALNSKQSTETITCDSGGNCPLFFIGNIWVSSTEQVQYLSSVQYCNTAEEPIAGTKTITLTVSDIRPAGTKQASTTATASITIVAVNDPPKLSVSLPEGLIYGSETTPIFDPDTIDLTDNDDTTFTSITITIVNPQDGPINEEIDNGGAAPGGGILNGPSIQSDGSFVFIISYAIPTMTSNIIESIKEIRYQNNAGQDITTDVPRVVCIEVSDSVSTSLQVCVTFELSPANLHAPEFQNSSASLMFSYDETDSPIVIGNVVAVDTDTDPVAAIIHYSIDTITSVRAEDGAVVDTIDEGLFVLDSSSGLVTAPLGFDAEQYTSHNCTIQARDNGNPNRLDYALVVVNVLDINDNAPQFTGDLPYTVTGSTVREELDIAVSRTILIMTASDADFSFPNNDIDQFELLNNYKTVDNNDNEVDLFLLNPTTGVISFLDRLDADVLRIAILNVSVTDGGSPPLISYTTVVIIPQDINDNPPSVDQVADALYVTSLNTAQSIGPALRIVDGDETALVEDVTVTLSDAQSISAYLDCLDCQENRLSLAGLLDTNPPTDLMSLATFDGDYTDIEIGSNNCSAKRFVRTATPANDGYGRIPRSSVNSSFATGEFSFSMVLNVTNEGYPVIITDNDDENASPSIVNRLFSIWFRKTNMRLTYTFGNNQQQSINIIPPSQFFETIPGSEFNATHHYVIVVRNNPNTVELYDNCELANSANLVGVLTTPGSNDVFIARSIPGNLGTDSTGGGHLGGDLHGLYYFPYALSQQQIYSYCSCEYIRVPESYSSAIDVTEATITTIKISPNGSNDAINTSDVNAFLRGIKYQNFFGSIGSSRSLQFTAVDNTVIGTKTSDTTGSIEFVATDDSIPVIDLNGVIFSGINYNVSFSEDGGTADIVGAQVTIYRDNVATPTIQQVLVWLSNPLDGDAETISATGTSFISVNTINSSYLEINGPGIPSEFVTVLKTLKYDNTDQKPTVDIERQIYFTVYDTEGRWNNPLASTFVTVGPTNDAPTLVLNDTFGDTTKTTTFMEGGNAVTLAGGAVIKDIDHDLLDRAEISIVDNFVPNADELLVTTVGNILSSYDSNTGVLSLSGVASIADYQATIRNITFDSTHNPLLDDLDLLSIIRMVAITVHDGEDESNEVTVFVEFMTINDPPVINFNGSSTINYVEGEDPVFIAPSAYITDLDNQVLFSMRIELEEGGITGDRVQYGDNEATLLNFPSDTVSNLITILRNVSYFSTEDEPLLLNRTIVITVQDSVDSNATEVKVTVTITNKNEHPPTFITPGSLYEFSVAENSPIGTQIGSATATDNDRAQTIFTFTLSGTTEIEIESVNGSTAYIVTTRQFDYESDVTSFTETLTVSDGELESSIAVNVSVTNVNEPPTLSLTSTSSVAGAEQSIQLIAGQVTIEDPDDGSLTTSSELSITGIPEGSDETLTLNSTITGYTFTSSDSTYTLSRSSNAVIDMADALLYIQYTAGTILDVLVVRKVTIVVADENDADSNEVLVDVTLADIPVFDKTAYLAVLEENAMYPDFLQVQAAVANPNDDLTYSVAPVDGVSIDSSTGYLSYDSVLDYETTGPTFLFNVYATATVPLPRTATTTVLVTVTNINDEATQVTGLDAGLVIDLGENVRLFENVTIVDPDDFPLDSVNVSFTGSVPTSPFTGRACVDEPNTISKMFTICSKSTDFVNLLAQADQQLINFDGYDNRILSLANSPAVVTTNLSMFEEQIDLLSFTFWLKPDAGSSGYVAFFSNSDGTERYFTVYYDSDASRIEVTMKQMGDGLSAQVIVAFQLPQSIEDGWYHFFMIHYDSPNMYCSLDGVAVISSAVVYGNSIGETYGEYSLLIGPHLVNFFKDTFQV